MEYGGYRLANLYKDAEKDIIDDLKDEVVYLKKKLKQYQYREDDFEEEIGDMTVKNDNLKREMEKADVKNDNLKREMEKADEKLSELNKII